jgi:hypothetical protein
MLLGKDIGTSVGDRAGGRGVGSIG